MTEERRIDRGEADQQRAADPPEGAAADRVIDLSVEVVGSPEEVWQAIATGPGITSWFVPTTVEERLGGATVSTFGDDPAMAVPGRVTAWEPPRRVRFEGDGVDAGLAFEWLVEARGGGTCVVRLVNSGFGTGEEWDAQYDGMTEGWSLFLCNLRLHRRHFPGLVATPILPGAQWPGPRAAAWSRLLRELGLGEGRREGDGIEVAVAGAPRLAGTVVEAAPHRLSVLLDAPAPGTAFLAAEGDGEQIAVSVWCYLYGDEARSIAERDASAWASWLAARAAT